jgi:hypothetical protein
MVYNTQEGSDARKITDQFSAAAGRIMAPVGAALNKVDTTVGQYAGPIVQGALQRVAGTASDVAGMLPVVGVAAKGVEAARLAAASGKVDSGVARTPIEVAKAAGFRVSPSSVHNATAAGAKPNFVARAAEDIASPLRVRADDIRHNKPVVNSIAAQDIGLPANTVFTDDAIAKAKAPAIAVYDKVATSVPLGPLARDTLTKIGKAGFDDLVPGQVIPADAQRTKDALLGIGEMNGQELKDTISRLRQQGYERTRPNVPGGQVDPDKALHGNTQLEIANALEDELAARANLVNGTLAADFVKARELFAKVGTVERARTGYDVDPHALKTAARKTNALTGGLAVIADAATHFPDDFNIRVPPYQETASGRSFTGSTLGYIPGVRKTLQLAIGVTRGEAATPQMGPRGPLSYYYRGDEYKFPVVSRDLTLMPGRDYIPQSKAEVRVKLRDALSLSTKERRAALHHPAAADRPLESTETRRIRKEKMDHIVSVLAARRKKERK